MWSQRDVLIFRQLATDLLLGSLQHFTGWAANAHSCRWSRKHHQCSSVLSSSPFSWLKSACDSFCMFDSLGIIFSVYFLISFILFSQLTHPQSIQTSLLFLPVSGCDQWAAIHTDNSEMHWDPTQNQFITKRNCLSVLRKSKTVYLWHLLTITIEHDYATLYLYIHLGMSQNLGTLVNPK